MTRKRKILFTSIILCALALMILISTNKLNFGAQRKLPGMPVAVSANSFRGSLNESNPIDGDSLEVLSESDKPEDPNAPDEEDDTNELPRVLPVESFSGYAFDVDTNKPLMGVKIVLVELAVNQWLIDKWDASDRPTVQQLMIETYKCGVYEPGFSEFVQEVITDSNGKYSFDGLKAQGYMMGAFKPMYCFDNLNDDESTAGYGDFYTMFIDLGRLEVSDSLDDRWRDEMEVKDPSQEDDRGMVSKGSSGHHFDLKVGMRSCCEFVFQVEDGKMTANLNTSVHTNVRLVKPGKKNVYSTSSGWIKGLRNNRFWVPVHVSGPADVPGYRSELQQCEVSFSFSKYSQTKVLPSPYSFEYDFVEDAGILQLDHPKEMSYVIVADQLNAKQIHELDFSLFAPKGQVGFTCTSDDSMLKILVPVRESFSEGYLLVHGRDIAPHVFRVNSNDKEKILEFKNDDGMTIEGRIPVDATFREWWYKTTYVEAWLTKDSLMALMPGVKVPDYVKLYGKRKIKLGQDGRFVINKLMNAEYQVSVRIHQRYFSKYPDPHGYARLVARPGDDPLVLKSSPSKTVEFVVPMKDAKRYKKVQLKCFKLSSEGQEGYPLGIGRSKLTKEDDGRTFTELFLPGNYHFRFQFEHPESGEVMTSESIRFQVDDSDTNVTVKIPQFFVKK